MNPEGKVLPVQSVQNLSEFLQEAAEVSVDETSSNGNAVFTKDDYVRLSWADIRVANKSCKPSKWLHPRQHKFWMAEEEQEILHGIVGEIQPGQIIAIMGGSGAGKSTLLNTLAGRLPRGRATGVVLVNGKKRDPKNWRSLVSYLHHSEFLDESLTVQETLDFHIKLKTSASRYNREEKDRKVAKLIGLLGLEGLEACPIGELSDGHRKLVTIGAELAGERRILFLDEPTTGMDSSTAEDIVRLLRSLARRYSLSIILTIHQPKAKTLELFDRLLLLSQGQTMFYGCLPEALEHIKRMTGRAPEPHENPADFIIDATNLVWGNDETQAAVDMLGSQWKSIEESHGISSAAAERSGLASVKRTMSRTSRPTTLFMREENPEPGGNWPVSYPYEIMLLCKRYWRIEYRRYAENLLLLAEFIVLGLILGFIYFQLTTANFGGYQSRMGLCSQLSRILYYIIVLNMGDVFLDTRKQMAAERASHSYRLSAAFVSRTLTLLPLRLICVALFSIIVYFLAGFRTDTMIPFLIYFFILQLVALCMIAFGLVLSTLLNTYNQIISVSILTGDFFLIFSGTPVLSPSIPPELRWMRWLSPIYFSNQALVQNEVSGLTIGGLPGDYYLDLFYMNQISIMWAAGGLMITTAGYFLIAYTCLYWRTRPKFVDF